MGANARDCSGVATSMTFLRPSTTVDRNAVVDAVSEADQATVDAVEDQVERKISEGHRYDRVQRVRVTAADHIP